MSPVISLVLTAQFRLAAFLRASVLPLLAILLATTPAHARAQLSQVQLEDGRAAAIPRDRAADERHVRDFSGYYFRPDKQEWMLISSWRAPKEGGWLRGLHSFSGNFVGMNRQLRRKALFGNQ